ncbi:MAG: T9SS type A sorting domain-containing protein [Deferribacteres bacterium]|nr:T9SS type A sorting domain-containing protein [Deferribacteres bacterium]
MRILQLLVSVFFISYSATASTFTSPQGSPLERREHPRLFFTQNDFAAVRAKISGYYTQDFQKFVSHMDGLMATSPMSGELAGWNHLFGAARSYALLYQIDPTTINGVQASFSRTDYGRKAIEIAMYLAQNLPESWDEQHHGAKNLTSDEGGLATLALQVVYDWTHGLSTLDERRAMADRLIILWENKYDNDKVKLENHYAANAHAYAGALCFYGDNDLGAAYSTKAQIMMDSFQDVFIERQLGVAAKLYEGSSDWIEGDTYSMDAFIGIGFLAAAAGSAMGEDYFASNSWLHYAPYYLYYNMVPMAYQGVYYWSQHNTSSMLNSEDSNPSQLMNMIAARLYASDPDLAGFAAWFCEQSPYGHDVDDYNYYDSHIFDFFYKFVFGTRHIPKLSPNEAEIALSFKLGQSHVMRSDHRDDAALVQFYSFKYWYPNGHNEEEVGAINIHRFGPLAVGASNSKNSGDGIPRVDNGGKGMALNNVFGLGSDQALELEMVDIRMSNADVPADFDDGDPAHIGTVEAREYMRDEWDYVNYNYSRSYADGEKASQARRAILFWRGGVNSDYLFVMDRVTSGREKYFVLHTPVDIEAIDGNWAAAGSGHWTSTAKTVRVTNRIDQAHGQMYISSVFPQQTTLHKFGGPGFEWVWADGQPLDYSSSEFSEKAAYLLSDHTLQIRSQDSFFLTVMKLGDANSLKPQTVQGLSGSNWAGALADEKRLVIFSKTEAKLQDFSYTVSSEKWVKHFIAELETRREFTVTKAGKVITSGTTGPSGRIFFYDIPGNNATYTVTLGGTTSVEEHAGNVTPSKFGLSNYPNPFFAPGEAANSGTTLSFNLQQPAQVSLAVYNTAGQLVTRLANEALPAGQHRLRWNGRSSDGRRLASGVYFCRLQVNGQAAVQKKLVMVR